MNRVRKLHFRFVDHVLHVYVWPSRIADHRSLMSSLAEKVLSGDKRSIGRAISAVEDARGAAGLLKEIFPHTGNAMVIGITGAPGAGKSTLVDRLAAQYRAGGERVGIIAVDPSSPFTGGALLGDRIRMRTWRPIRESSSEVWPRADTSGAWPARLLMR